MKKILMTTAERITKLLMLLTIILFAACTDNKDNPSDNPQQTPVDAGPAYTDKTVDVNRDGKAYGQVALRFYSDMPSVAYLRFGLSDNEAERILLKIVAGGYIITKKRSPNGDPFSYVVCLCVTCWQTFRWPTPVIIFAIDKTIFAPGFGEKK